MVAENRPPPPPQRATTNRKDNIPTLAAAAEMANFSLAFFSQTGQNW